MSSPQHKPVAAPAFSQEELRNLDASCSTEFYDELMQADLELHEFEEKNSIINVLKEGRSFND